MDYNEVIQNADFHGATSIKMQAINLHNSIGKCMTMCEDRLEKMEVESLNTTPSGKVEYDICKDMLSCYTDLYNTKVRNKRELEDLEWLFNKGKLRDKEEVEERYNLRKKQEYMDQYYPGERALTSMEEYEVEDLFRPLILFVTVLLAEVLICLLTNDYSSTKDYAIAITIASVFTFFPAYLIIKGICLAIEWVKEHALFKSARNNGYTPPLNKGLIATSAVYAFTVAKAFGKSKKK